MAETLDLTELRAALAGTRFAAQLQHFRSIDSTNTQLLAAAAAGAPEGTVYLADEQTAGRGRGDHRWHSELGSAGEPEGLYVSALVRPALHLQQALLLSLATGLAAWQAVQQVTGLQLDLHWPNDLYVREKKLGGILVETAVEPGVAARLRYAVIGVGLNLQQRSFPAQLAAAASSLALECGHQVSRSAVLVALLRALDLELTQLESEPASSPLLARFTARSTWVVGRRVRVPEQGGYTGTTAGLDERGFLRVAADDGSLRTVLSGGVRAG